MKKLVSSLAIASAFVSTLSADKVSLSNDGLGDFLVAPMYVAKDNVCSSVTVFNTNETNSILAKVTFREQIASEEVDLPIFLSPGDVWEGTVCDTDNGVVLTSNDDSNHPAIQEVLMKGKNLTNHSSQAGHTNIDFTKGYVEIYPIAQFNELSTAKVDKEVLVRRWNALIKGDKSNVKLRKNGVDGYSLSGSVAFKAGMNGEIVSSLPMLAFKGTHDKQVTGSAIAYSNDTSPELLLGQGKKNEILKVLQNKVTSFTYTNSGKDQYINFTFPFSYSSEQVRTYKVTLRDMSENKDTRKEKVIIFSPAPVKKVSVNSIENEVSSISIEDIISKSMLANNFKRGMIQIKDVTNNNNVQLGEAKLASFIAVKYQNGRYMYETNSNAVKVVNSISYVPSK